MTCTCKATSLERDITTEAYEAYGQMVKSIVYKFVRQYGGDFEEILAEANKIFCLACQRYDPTVGTDLITYLYSAIRKELYCLHKRNDIRMHGHKIISLEKLRPTVNGEEQSELNLSQTVKETTTDIGLLLSDLGEDCKNIVMLILFPPEDFRKEINTYDDGETLRECLAEYLRFHLKWPANRIKKAFVQIQRTMA